MHKEAIGRLRQGGARQHMGDACGGKQGCGRDSRWQQGVLGMACCRPGHARVARAQPGHGSVGVQAGAQPQGRGVGCGHDCVRCKEMEDHGEGG